MRVIDFISAISANLVSSFGLVLDIVGAVLIYLYGLPENISRTGVVSITLEQVDENEIIKAKKYDLKSRIGIILLILGFFLQLVGNFL